MKNAITTAILLAMGLGGVVQADIRLIGKTFVHAWTVNTFPKEWPTPKYETRFCDEKTLVWNNVTNLQKVESGVEEYELTELSPGVLQITWKESPDTSNYGVVWTLNFRTYAIYGVLVNLDPHANYVVAGGFSFRDGVQAEPPLRACP